MANRTDPLIHAVSGSDPQNLLEYITRQKVYDSRYWKESCFGLTVEDVLEKAATSVQCIGGLPTKFLALLLKLLQLHPETDTIVETFLESNDDFKYARALGSLYVRMTGQPVDIYEALEPLYRDSSKLRVWNQTTAQWSLLHMDEFIHQLLQQPALHAGGAGGSPTVLGITLPRLPARAALVEAGYLPEGERRPTALQDILKDPRFCGTNDDDDGDAMADAAAKYLEYKALVEKSPPAIAAWEKRLAKLGLANHTTSTETQPKEGDDESAGRKQQQQQQDSDVAVAMEDANSQQSLEEQKERSSKTGKPAKKKQKKGERNYQNLFKKSVAADDEEGETSKKKKKKSSNQDVSAHEEGSEDYWNEQRERLGLKPLRPK